MKKILFFLILLLPIITFGQSVSTQIKTDKIYSRIGRGVSFYDTIFLKRGVAADSLESIQGILCRNASDGRVVYLPFSQFLDSIGGASISGDTIFVGGDTLIGAVSHWDITSTNIENNNTGNVSITTELHAADSAVFSDGVKFNDTVNFERDAIPVFKTGDPVYGVFAPRKTGVSTNRQMALMSLIELYNETQDTLRNAGSGKGIPLPDSIYYSVLDTNYYNADSNSVGSFRTASSFLPNWRADFANAHYPEMVVTEDNAKFAMIGDSYSALAMANLNKYSQKIYGYGGGYQPFVTGSIDVQGVYCNIGANWTTGIDATDTLILNSGYAESSTVGATIMIGAPYFNKLRFFYKQVAGGGTFSYQLGASGTPTNVSTDGATAAMWCYKNFAALKSNPTDTVIVKVVSGSVRLYGFYFQNDLNTQIFAENPRKVELHNLAIGGTTVSNFVGKNAAAVKTLIDTLDISAFLMMWLDIDAEDPYANYPTLITNLRTAKATTDYIIITPYNNKANLGQSQAKKYRALAKSLNVGYLDISNLAGLYAKTNAAGLMADTVHFNSFGNSIIYKEISNLLFPPTHNYEALQTQGLSVNYNSIIFPNSTSIYVTSVDKRIKTGTNNSIFGYAAANSITSAYQNAAFGALALEDLTSGALNVAVGYSAAKDITSATYNVAVGKSALAANKTGEGNTAIGSLALEKTTGQLNTGVGYLALAVNVGGINNTAMGAAALITNTTGSNNVAYGFSALRLNATGLNNIAVGYRAGWKETGSYKSYWAADSTSYTVGMGSGSKLLFYGDMSNADKANHTFNIYAKVGISQAKLPSESLEVTGNAVVTGWTSMAFLQLAPSADPPAGATEGMIYADTDHKLYYYNGTAWKEIAFVP